MVEALAAFYLPLFLGVVYGRLRTPSDAELTYLSRLVLYLLLPFLLFRSTYAKASQGITLSSLSLPLLAALVVLSSGAAAYLLFGSLEEVMTTMYSNAGYLPLAVALPLWGEPGVADVGFYILGNNTTSNTLIPVLSSREGLAAGLRRLAYFAPLYGIAAGTLAGIMHIAVPDAVIAASKYLGDAAPTMALIILGLEFSRRLALSRRGVEVYLLHLAIASVLVALFRISGLIPGRLEFYVAVLEAVMPSAVSNVVLAREFGLDAGRVSEIVVTSTLLASFTAIPLFLLWASTPG